MSLWSWLFSKPEREAEREAWRIIGRRRSGYEDGIGRTNYARGPKGTVEDWTTFSNRKAAEQARKNEKSWAKTRRWLEKNPPGQLTLPAGEEVPEQLALPPAQARHAGRYAVVEGPDAEGQASELRASWDEDGRYTSAPLYADTGEPVEFEQWNAERLVADEEWIPEDWFAARDEAPWEPTE